MDIEKEAQIVVQEPSTRSRFRIGRLKEKVRFRDVVAAMAGVALAGTLILGTMAVTEAFTNNSSSNNSNSMDMGTATGTSNEAGIPKATQTIGAQPAQYTTDADGTKVFHFTAEQVMWPVEKNMYVKAWTLDGTVPGPTIRVTAGDHVRITIDNKFHEPTTIHWHGLEIPTGEDGVPGIGQDPIQPGTSFTYDFTIKDDNIGTNFYHSHYDDLVQESGGLYGAFIVDPRPGTPEYDQAQKVKYDQEYLQMISELDGHYVINGKSFPDTTPMTVKTGQTIRIRMINIGEMIHPMHLHGHQMTIVAKDGIFTPTQQTMDTIAIAPGESYDVNFNAWAAPGSVYPFHCHILAHVMGNGPDEMGGLITLVEYEK